MQVVGLRDRIMGKAKELLKRSFPFAKSLKVLVYSFKAQMEKRYYTCIIKKKQQKKLGELRGKEKIKCVILLHVASTFREYLYQLMLDSNRFDIYLVISPEWTHGGENKKRHLVHRAVEHLARHAYCLDDGEEHVCS